MKNKFHFEDVNNHQGFYYRKGKQLFSKQSSWQKVEVYETQPYGNTLFLDGYTQVGEFFDNFYHEPMAHIPLISHSSPEAVLVVGGGDGGIVREILRHKIVQKIVHVDIDEIVVEACKKHLPNISSGCWDNKKVQRIIEDGREYVKDYKNHFDIIIVDLTDPGGPSTALYQKEFYQLLKEALKNKKESALMLHSESPLNRPYAFSSIHKTLNKIFPEVTPFYSYVAMYGGYWSFALCTKGLKIKSLKNKKISNRLKKRKLKKMDIFSADYFIASQMELPIVTKIRKKEGEVIDEKVKDFKDSSFSCYSH